MGGSSHSTPLPFYKLFASSAAAAVTGEVLTLPMDTAKVRLQLQLRSATPKYRGPLGTMMTVAREEGLGSLWKGLTPGIHRQVLLGGLRIATYEPIKNFYAEKLHQDADHTSIPVKIAAALTAGTVGVLVGNPTDVLKVRMQAQGKLPPGAPKTYPSAMAAYGIIVRKEGLRALWTGTTPNIARNAIVNAAELATYDQIKHNLIATGFFQDNVACHLASSLCAGFIAVCVGSPADVIKSRMMANKGYSGVGDAVLQTLRKEGPLAFWAGFSANFARLGAWNCAMFLTLEQIRKLMGATSAKH